VELLREFHIITPAHGQMVPRPAKDGRRFTMTTPDRSSEFADYLLEIAPQIARQPATAHCCIVAT
jgi:hypothetical protein